LFVESRDNKGYIDDDSPLAKENNRITSRQKACRPKAPALFQLVIGK
jgi:hypothetical protein